MAILKDLIVHSASRFIGKIYASGGIVGDLTGTAEKATKDASGNTITSYYEPKSNVTSKGSATQPIYFDSNGVAQNTTYTLGKSVPSDAKFTDTTYNNATTSAAGLMSSGDKTALESLKTNVGDTAVSTQISTAIAKKADLDDNGKVPSSQLPSYVDDVIEGYLSSSKFYKTRSGSSGSYTYSTEIAGETGKIYVDLSNNKTYRYSGSNFTVISETLALGETSSTAYRGDRGKTAYDHSQAAHAPSDAQKNVQSDWNATSGDALILNKPNYAGSSSAGGAATSANVLNDSGTLDTQEKIDGFLEAKKLKYATFKTTEANNVGMGANDGMILSIPWTTSSYGSQLAFDDAAAATMKVRGMVNNAWGDWKTVLTTANYNNYSPKQDGTGATGTWNIGISGNAATATNATSATKATQDGSGNNIVNTYATKTALSAVSTLVGDTAVSTQINSAKLKHSPSSTTKAYITGTSTSTENTNNDYFDTGVYLSTTAGKLETGSVSVGATSSAAGKCAIEYDNAVNAINFVFG